jgi:hypothetical protein
MILWSPSAPTQLTWYCGVRSAKLAKEEHFQIACQKSFNGRYDTEDDDVVTHPNDYFDRAMALGEEAASSSSSQAEGEAPLQATLTSEQRTMMARNKAAALARAKAAGQKRARESSGRGGNGQQQPGGGGMAGFFGAGPKQ